MSHVLQPVVVFDGGKKRARAHNCCGRGVPQREARNTRRGLFMRRLVS